VISADLLARIRWSPNGVVFAKNAQELRQNFCNKRFAATPATTTGD
jgi:hypothetical protein